MIPQKKIPKKQLEKYSVIFLQISLMLVLFVTYVIMENTMGKIIFPEETIEAPDAISFPSEPQHFVKEIKKKQVAVVQALPKLIDLVKKGDPPKVVAPIVKTTIAIIPASLSTTNNNKKSAHKEVPQIVKPFYSFRMVTPLFKGCENLSNEENRVCFEKKMKRFVQKKFDSNLGGELGLLPGDYKIYAQFIIDEKGEVIDIEVRAPHVRLQKNVLKMIGRLPQFKPGEVAGKKVKVRYLLPIKFQVD